MSKGEFAFQEIIDSVEKNIIGGGAITRDEAETLSHVDDENFMRLLAVADKIRILFKGNIFDSCSLISARAGRCSEDCAFCAQSAKYDTDCETYPLVSKEKIVQAAKEAEQSGASRFCAVTSGGALSDKEFDSLIEALETVNKSVDLALDASLGFLDDTRAERLRLAGVTRYNHNLETCRDLYPTICSTHTYDQRVDTVKKVIGHGISACCGGIIGMGESFSQRLDMAFGLAQLGVDCVPVNILNPRPGTPLESATPPEPMEILKTLALFRLILPRATIKIAGGREANLRDFQAMALRSGANGMIIGGYLTTSGRSLDQDVQMVREAGMQMP
jgi:biotin synthase